MYAGTCDLESNVSSAAVGVDAFSLSSSSSSSSVVNVVLQKQHAIPQLTRVDEARVRIKACCLDEWDVRVST